MNTRSFIPKFSRHMNIPSTGGSAKHLNLKALVGLRGNGLFHAHWATTHFVLCAQHNSIQINLRFCIPLNKKYTHNYKYIDACVIDVYNKNKRTTRERSSLMCAKLLRLTPLYIIVELSRFYALNSIYTHVCICTLQHTHAQS